MFISARTWHTTGGQHSQGAYLMVFQQRWEIGEAVIQSAQQELRCLLRQVRFNQLGHFMTGRVQVKLPGETDKLSITLSGSLGSDGLPLDIPKLSQAPGKIPSRLWDMLTPMPQKLAEQYWRSDRESGTEAKAHEAIKRWAKKNLPLLRKLHVSQEEVETLT